MFFSVPSYSLEKRTWFSMLAGIKGIGSVIGESKTPEPEKSTGLDE